MPPPSVSLTNSRSASLRAARCPRCRAWPGMIAGFPAMAMPARWALERGAWTEAAALPVNPAAQPYMEAMTRFARALGAARSGQPDAAKAEVDQLAALRDKEIAVEGRLLDDAGRHPAAGRPRRWMLWAQGRKDDGDQDADGGCGPRRYDREICRHAWPAGAGPRTARRDAARSEAAGAMRSRSLKPVSRKSRIASVRCTAPDVPRNSRRRGTRRALTTPNSSRSASAATHRRGRNFATRRNRPPHSNYQTRRSTLTSA